MPLGGAKLNTIARYVAPAAAVGQRTAKSIIAYGNAKISTTQKKFGGSSFFVDGSGDYIKANTHAIPASGPFTLEFWYRSEALGTVRTLCGQYLGGTANEFTIWQNTNDTVNMYYQGATGHILTSTTGISDLNWHHIAITRNASNRFDLWIDGTSEDNVTETGDLLEYDFMMGARFNGGGPNTTEHANGYFDEVRVSDTVRYTSNFTPSTTPFVNDANTLLLIHADGTNNDTVLIDDNGERAPIGINSVSSQAVITTSQYKFGTGSVRFDGNTNTDQRLYAYGAASGITTGDFTLECWARFDNFSALHAVTYIGGQAFYVGSDGKIAYYYGSGTTGTTVMSTNTWYHLAWSRSGTNLRMFVNGNLEVTRTDSTSLNNDLLIGCKGINDQDMRGYIDEYRFSSTARYTSSFTAPTTAFTNDSDTTFLGHFDQIDSDTTVMFDDNGGTLPTRPAVTSTALGNAQLDTAQYKFGTSSLLLDGTGDVVRLDNLADSIGTGDFTIEMWARPNTLPSNLSAMFTWNHEYDWNEDPDGTVVPGFVISQNVFHYGTSTNSGTYSSGMSTGTWTHVALVRNSGTIKIYYDGVEKASVSNTSNYTIGSIKPAIGVFDRYIHTSPPLGGRFLWDGWIDELRISTIARYTSGFTPPTSAFTNDTDTLILYHFNGTDGSTTFTDDRI